MEIFSFSSSEVFRGLLLVAIILGSTLLATRLAERAIQALARALQISPLALSPLKIGVYSLISVLAATILLGYFFSVNLISVLGSILALIAIGFFAVWSILSHILCSLLLLLVRPFQIGDHIELPPDTYGGKVVGLNLFFTTLKQNDGRLVQIPNNLFFQRVMLRRVEGPPSVPHEPMMKI